MSDVTTTRRLTVQLPPNSTDRQTPAFSYVELVSAALDDQARDVNGAKQIMNYGGTAAGLGTAISTAAKAPAAVSTGFGALTAALTATNTAAGIDSKAQILSKAQAAIACLEQAEVLLATPASPPAPAHAAAVLSLADPGAIEPRLRMLLTPADVHAATQPSLAQSEAYVAFASVSAAALSTSLATRNAAITANQAYASGQDGQLPWFLVREAWTIWHTAQQQLQSSSGSLSDVLSGAKSAISAQASQPAGSAKAVADASKTATVQAQLIAQIAVPASGGQIGTLDVATLTGTGGGADPGQTADGLFAQLQQTVAKCPSQVTPATTPAKPTGS